MGKLFMVKDLLGSVISGNRAALAQAITLLESNSRNKSVLAKKLDLIHSLYRYHSERNPNSIRLCISGAPGCGKSTFIENFGMYLIEKQKKVAVLAVDPSSPIRGGSILADKTRMSNLTKNSDKTFIRPSPSRGLQGGVRGMDTANTILLCESAGYDVILIETVGVGQSEYEAAHLSDTFMLLMAPSSGDELQGIKKGIVEMANQIIITKYDGDLKMAARRMRGEIRSATKYFNHEERPSVFCVSSLTKEGIEDVWKEIDEIMRNTATKEEKRKEQKLKMLKIALINELFALLNQTIQYEKYEQRLKSENTLSVYELVQEIIYKDLFSSLKHNERD